VKPLAIALLAAMLAAACSPSKAQMWLTTADQKHKLEPQKDIASAGKAKGGETVVIDTSKHFQTIQGFGAAMTDASAEVISRLPENRRRALMEELFGRKNGGLGLSFTRLTVGASDFSRTAYSFDDSPGNAPDPELRHFSIAPAMQYVVPRMREALAINPDLKVLISPWSAPAWMKRNRSLIKGQLNPQFYPAFGEYLARTAEAFGRAGVPIAMLTIQNEPNFEPEDYPGMRVDHAQRAVIIGRNVGPALRAHGLKTQILDWDHNWDHPEMPLAVLADPVARQYVAGVAWHCYYGDVPAQSPVHDAYPDKDAWETECSGGDWSPKFADSLDWMTEKLIIGAANNWARGSLTWNLALDPAHGPHHGGCTGCNGVVTIDPATGAVTRNVEYYVLGHASRFVLPGAYRVGSATHGQAVEAAAFLNPDGSRVAVLLCKSADYPITIAIDGKRYVVELPKGSVATLRWGSRSAGK
jgi:glucosylceramidase